MNYKEDKRTKNLSLHDIHVGDWVQAWDDITKRYTPPERITAIFDDGTVYTEIDPEQGDPFEYNISEIDTLPITSDLLLGFGFKKDEDFYFYGNGFSFIAASHYRCKRIRFYYMNKSFQYTELKKVLYMHELQQALRERHDCIGMFTPQWKGL